MNLKNILLVTILVSVLISVEAKGYSAPPKFLIDKGICPFECCTYKTWIVGSSTKIYEKPNLNSKILTTLMPTERALALTCEIHVKPVKFFVKRIKTIIKSVMYYRSTHISAKGILKYGLEVIYTKRI